MADGIGCTCCAYGECECSCGVDWTPQELIDAREKIAHLERLLMVIGDFAHDNSTGPAVHDALWDIRRMAYEQ